MCTGKCGENVVLPMSSLEEVGYAELYEDMHNRMELRSRISNALMAIALYEANSKTENMQKYIDDGLNLSKDLIDALAQITKGETENTGKYITKVFIDLLFRETSASLLDKEKLEMYKKNSEITFQTLGKIDNREVLHDDEILVAKKFLMDLDKEIEMTYEKEENLYFGYFRTTRI